MCIRDRLFALCLFLPTRPTISRKNASELLCAKTSSSFEHTRWQLSQKMCIRDSPKNPGTRTCAPMSQFVFVSKDGGSILRLPFRTGKWTAERIRVIAKAQGVTGEQILAISNTSEEFAEMKALTDVLAPDGTERDVAPLMAGAEMVGEMSCLLYTSRCV